MRRALHHQLLFLNALLLSMYEYGWHEVFPKAKANQGIACLHLSCVQITGGLLYSRRLVVGWEN